MTLAQPMKGHDQLVTRGIKKHLVECQSDTSTLQIPCPQILYQGL